MISLFDNKQNIEKLSKLNLQQKNKFKLLMIPSYESFLSSGGNVQVSASAVLGAALALAGNIVTSLYLQSITLPSSFSIEYDEISKLPKGLSKPENVSMTFLEDEKGTVWRYFQTWRKTIAYAAPPTSSYYGFDAAAKIFLAQQIEYVFADNQMASERIGILLPGNAADATLTYGTAKFPRIMLYGLKFKSIDDLTFSNEEGGNLVYTVNFSVKEVAAPLV